LTDQPNGAATVAEAAPPSCLHCKIRRADSPDNFTIPGHGTFRGPICQWCREAAAEPESEMVPTWSSGEEPFENPRRNRINADRAADILAKIIAWTPAKPDLKFADLFNVANLLRGWVVTKDDRLAGIDNGTLLWRIGLGKLPRSAREREKVLGNAPSAALRAVVLEECMIAAGWRPEDFMVLEPVDKNKVVVEPTGPAPESNEAKWNALAAKLADLEAWPEEEEGTHRQEFIRLTMLFSTELMMDEDRSALGARVRLQMESLLAMRNIMRASAKLNG